MAGLLVVAVGKETLRCSCWGLRTELIDLIEFYMEGGLEVAVHLWHHGGDSAHFIIEVFLGYSALWVSWGLLRRWSWNGCCLVILGKTIHIYWSGLLRDRALWIGKVLLRRWSSDGISSVTQGKRLWTFIVQVFSGHRTLHLVELCSGDVLEMAGQLMMILHGETKLTVQYCRKALCSFALFLLFLGESLY